MPYKQNLYTRKDTVKTFNFVAKTFPNHRIGFYKPRIATLLLSERGITSQAIGVRSATQAIELFNVGGIVITIAGGPYGNIEMLAELTKISEPVFTSGNYVVFAKQLHHVLAN
jgi:hypothetical protein